MKLNEMLDERRKDLLQYVYQKCNGTVQHGLFKGMKILNKNKWGDGDTGGKLLGVYEDELFPILEQVIETKPDLIINYGCAEGFYGVGLAMKLPESHVVMFDIESDSLRIAGENAAINFATNIEFTNNCNNLEYFESLLADASEPFVVMDCEGYEGYMLDPYAVPSLAKTRLLVEMHDCIRPGLTDDLIDKFNETHDLEGITQGNKNLHIEPITELSDVDKFIITNENRPCTMHWVYMTPKNKEVQE